MSSSRRQRLRSELLVGEIQPAHKVEFMPTSIIDPFSIAEGLLKVLSDFWDSLLRKSGDSRMILTYFLHSVMLYLEGTVASSS
jgi:hypothetical protein